MYDHQTESLWSQIAMGAVAGPMTGTKLRHLFLAHSTWQEWQHEHPSTLVLSTKPATPGTMTAIPIWAMPNALI